MKTILTTFLIFIVIPSFCQNREKFPRYYIENADTVGVIYSIEQAQKIYNNEILLSLFKDVRLGCDTLMKKYLVVVNKYEQKQLIDKGLIEQYEKRIKEQDITIVLCQEKSKNFESDLKKCDEQLNLKKGQGSNDVEIINILKKQRGWLLGGTIGFGAIALFLSGAVFVN